MKIAVWGVGSIGQRHIRNLITLGVPASDIYAHDVNTEALARLPDGVRRWPTAVTGIDVLLVCTPADQHFNGIEHAFTLGVPFFIEKPVVSDSTQLTLWQLDAADKIPHMVGYQWRFNRELQALRACASPTADIYAFCQTNIATWPGRYGDPLLECSHEIDLALSWMQDATWQAGRRQGTKASVTLKDRYRSAVVSVNWASVDNHRDVMLADPSGAAWRLMPSPASIDHSYMAEMDAFLKLVRGEPAEQGCTLREALAVVKMCEWTSAKVIV